MWRALEKFLAKIDPQWVDYGRWGGHLIIFDILALFALLALLHGLSGIILTLG